MAGSLVWTLGNRGQARLTPLRIVLAGAVLAALFTAFSQALLVINQEGLDSVLFWLADINFLHFAILLLGVSVTLLVVVSLLTPPEDDRKLAGLTVATVPPAEALEITPELRRQHQINVGWTVVLVGCVAAIWYYFSPLSQ